MAKSTTKSPKQKPEVSALPAAMMAGHPAAKLWLNVMAESTRFVSERLQNDLEAQKAMLRCESPVELVQLQSEFFRKAVEQYTSEAYRMMEIMTGAPCDEAGKTTRTSTKRRYDDIPV